MEDSGLNKRLNTLLFFIFLLTAPGLVSGAPAERIEFKEKNLWEIRGTCEFGDDIFRNQGKVRMITKEAIPVRETMIWQLRASVRSFDASGRIRIGFLPLDENKNVFKDSNGKTVILWCTREIKAGRRWKNICGGVSSVNNSELVNVKWIKNVKFTKIALESSGKVDIIEFALEKLEE